MRRAILIAITLASTSLIAADPPQAQISNGTVHAKLYLPDAADGYYRATRFDWSGVVASLEFQGHNFFGVWFPHYDPKLHDAITGPVEEYRTGESGLGSAASRNLEWRDPREALFARRDKWILPGHSLRLVGRRRQPRVSGP